MSRLAGPAKLLAVEASEAAASVFEPLPSEAQHGDEQSSDGGWISLCDAKVRGPAVLVLLTNATGAKWPSS